MKRIGHFVLQIDVPTTLQRQVNSARKLIQVCVCVCMGIGKRLRSKIVTSYSFIKSKGVVNCEEYYIIIIIRTSVFRVAECERSGLEIL